ncbi:MAG: hypothetical protein BRD25_05285, partial [Bacteroidetes bacterium QH_1_61_8]
MIVHTLTSHSFRRFLLNKVNEAEDSLVPLALLCSFERMRALLHLPDVSVDSLSKELLDTVAVILERSSSLHVDRENRRVGRAEPLGDPVEVEKLVEARSLHVKPFSKDWTMDGVFAWFDAIRPVRSVRFRRHAQSKDFKGEVFVEFDNRGVADEVRKMSLEWEGAPLKMQWKRDFIESKKASKQQLEQDAAFYQQNDQQANGDENIVDEEGFTVGLLLAFELDEEALTSVFRELEFDSFGDRLGLEGESVSEEETDEDDPDLEFDFGPYEKVQELDPEAVDYEVVETDDELRDFADRLADQDRCAFDTEATSRDPMTADLVGLSFSREPETATYVPPPPPDDTSADAVLDVLRPALSGEAEKVGHNLKYDLLLLKQHGVEVG